MLEMVVVTRSRNVVTFKSYRLGRGVTTTLILSDCALAPILVVHDARRDAYLSARV